MSDAKTIAVAVVEQDGQYLVGQRPAGVPLAGYWEFPGGKVQSNESPADAAVRECHEETGLQVKVVRQLDESTYDYDHGRLRLHFYLCHVLRRDQPSSPFQWMDACDLSQCRFPPANESVLKVLEH